MKSAETGLVFACMLFAAVSLFSSCKEETFEAAYFSLIDNSKSTYAKELQVSPDGGVRTLMLISNRNWSIDYEKASWITVSPTSGRGVATITITVTPNETLDEDYIYLNITNNTLNVVKHFKVTRQSFPGTYKGSSTVASPITYICTTCTAGEKPTTVTSSIALDSDNGKITLAFSTTLKTGAATYYQVDMPFEVTRQIVTTDGKTEFVFSGTGTYDMTGLGESLEDPSVAGVKNTVVRASLSNGKLTASVMIDPGANNAADPAKTTEFGFDGSK